MPGVLPKLAGLPVSSLPQQLLSHIIKDLVRIHNRSVMSDRIYDHAVPDISGIKGLIMSKAEDSLRLIKGRVHCEADCQKLVAGRIWTRAVKDLVGICFIQKREAYDICFCLGMFY